MDVNLNKPTPLPELPDVLRDGTRKPATLDGATYQAQFRNKTADIPRPTREEYPYWNDEHLATMQHSYDCARYWDRYLDQTADDANARKEAERKERERKQQEADDEQRAYQRSQLLAPAKRAYIQAGGSEADWAKQEDSIYQDILREQAVRAATAPSNVQSLVPRHSF